MENSIEIVKKFNEENRFRDSGKINNAIDDVIQKAISATLWEHMYKNLSDDFNNYKQGKDINYLDNNHHKQLVEKSIGQIIKQPEECWFDAIEVKIIRNNILYGANIEKDFITLKEISDEHPNECITVIAESPLSGAIYRYNNYGKQEWQLIGTMLGYA
jgi:hypothetical protein